MSTRTSTRASTVSSSQTTRLKSQESLKPYNKRSAKNSHIQAPPVKVRKLLHSGTPTQSVSVEIPAKTLASALKRSHENASLTEAPPVVVVPARRSPGKVRFTRQEPLQDSRRSSRVQTHENTQIPGDTVQVVVQIPRAEDGSGDKESNGPQGKIQSDVQKDDETHIVTTQFSRPQKFAPNPDADFQARYLKLKSLAWNWVQNHFSDSTPETKQPLNLLHLAHTSPQLMEYANWISCCGKKRTWEDVFNKQRAKLVYGILGKMLEVHVFGHEMFGADQAQLRALRELDLELVNRDGFYRQKCRAHKILAFLPNPDTPPPNFHHSLTALHASFIELLSPLLPSSPQPPPQPDLQPQLLAILLKAASLSLAMRRERQALYYWETHPAVGALFESESMRICDQTEHRDEDDWRRNTDVEVVTMAGWPGCVAYRPSNADDEDGKMGDDDGRKRKEQDNGKYNNNNNNNNKKAKLGVNRIGRAEVCVTFGPAVLPLSLKPANWLGKRLRVEMAERDQVQKVKDKNAAIKKNVAGVGVAVSAILGLEYVVVNPWILDEVRGFLGSFI